MIRPADSLQVPAPRKRALGLSVVVLMHVLFVWALHAGLGRELLQSTPVVVVAQLLSDAPQAVLPPVPESIPVPTSVPVPPRRAATAPPQLAAPPAQAPALEPRPAVVSAPAIAVSAAPAAPSDPPAPAPAAVASPAPAAPAPALAVRVAASLPVTGDCTKAEYPPLSLRREEEGTVHLRFLVGVDGRVVESQVEQSSGHRGLDEAARRALSLCRFKPGTVDGKPEPSWVPMKYTWRLK